MRRITIRVTPNASKTEIVGRELGVLKVRIAASATDGLANDALIRLLADEYDCAPSLVRIVKGATSKMKIVEFP
ncbi:hypothetical protein A3E39_00550 [Candidatus Uhrbacteria bacterium RIFCSPHIGHO2_12_FULL_60_25]|uniref:UPF0235 protein A3E39_00550 n=1 Tax=Candidatus Uhrbacteria bacterium RIFCSPHIGHO2_12_FULL_60_25 TaxID=1802399 RepID=A0A1F7UMF1_9BACT|nr:MAG: hypothetical protein A3E39_00550 [Candidatus Uhrbacteria bacterium RIFCSPHIGHO2_12_FULL_60_25]